MNDKTKTDRKALIVQRSEGRTYNMGRMKAIFHADSEETHDHYSISEWSLDPMTAGPGAHSHEDDHIFYVLDGTVTLDIDGDRTDASFGTYAVIPGGVPHDFSNRGHQECRFISINAPAGFESMMPRLVEWFASNPLGDIR